MVEPSKKLADLVNNSGLGEKTKNGEQSATAIESYSDEQLLNLDNDVDDNKTNENT